VDKRSIFIFLNLNINNISIMKSNRIVDFLDVYKRYSGEGSPELEISLHNVDRGLFLEMLQKFNIHTDFTNKKTELMIDFIYDTINDCVIDKANQTKYIISVKFDTNAKSIGKHYYKKSRIAYPISEYDILNYNIKLSEELDIPEFKSMADPLTRFKARSSYNYGDWRIDLTIIKQASFETIKNSLKKLCTIYFKDRNLEFEIEHIGDRSKIKVANLDITQKIWSIVSPEYLNKIQYQKTAYKIAKHIYTNTDLIKSVRKSDNVVKKLANQVVTLTKQYYYNNIYPPEGYYLAPKIDGYFIFGMIEGNKMSLIGNKYNEFTTEGEFSLCIFCGEYVESLSRLYVVDCLFYDGTPLNTLPFSERVTYLKKMVKIINMFVPFADIQTYYKINMNSFGDLVEKIYNMPRDFEIDGLIMVEPTENYLKTKNYKWKPASQNTIDFLAVKLPQKYIGIYPFVKKEGYNLYVLMNGINISLYHRIKKTQLNIYTELINSLKIQTNRDYFPTHFSSTINENSYLYYHKSSSPDVHGKIIELGYDGLSKMWVFNRVREDRALSDSYFGNDFKVAELNYINNIDIFDLKDLYLKTEAYLDTSFGNIGRIRKTAINKIFDQYLSKSNQIIDINPRTLLAVPDIIYIENDPKIVSNIVTTKYKNVSGKSKIVYTNLKNDILTFETKADSVVCLSEFHNYCDSVDNLNKILQFVANNLKVTGLFIAIVIEGVKVFELLNSKQYYTDGNMTLEKLYKSSSFTGINQPIKICIEDICKTENIANIKKITSEANKNKLKLLEEHDLSSFVDSNEPFISLYKVLIFSRKNS